MIRARELRLRLVADDHVDPDFVQREFPHVPVERSLAWKPSDLVVDDHVWRGAFDLRSLDERVEQSGSALAIAVRGYDVTNIACEVASRYQRFFARRNRGSSGRAFDGVLDVLGRVYGSSDELKADRDHVLDTWQWVLRLSPDAGLAVQIAALFHDVFRLSANARERTEHRVPDEQALADARRSARVADVFAELADVGVRAEDNQRAREIIFAPSRRGGDPEVLLLDDAEALSFLSLGSSVYSDYFGVAQTRRKVAFTLSRLGAAARAKLELVRLRPDIERLLREVAA